jgi:hypothetical protein
MNLMVLFGALLATAVLQLLFDFSPHATERSALTAYRGP